MKLKIGNTYTYNLKTCNNYMLDYKRYYYTITGKKYNTYICTYRDSYMKSSNRDAEITDTGIDDMFELGLPPQEIITRRSIIV